MPLTARDKQLLGDPKEGGSPAALAIVSTVEQLIATAERIAKDIEDLVTLLKGKL